MDACACLSLRAWLRASLLCAFVAMPCPSWAGGVSHRRGAPPTTRSRSPAGATARRAFPRECDVSLRERTRLPVSTGTFLRARPGARVPWLPCLASVLLSGRELARPSASAESTPVSESAHAAGQTDQEGWRVMLSSSQYHPSRSSHSAQQHREIRAAW